MAQQTQLKANALPGKPFGSFAGKVFTDPFVIGLDVVVTIPGRRRVPLLVPGTRDVPLRIPRPLQ